ncbi:MAG: superoxide dismutase [Deltaproteobacteria bacterium]|nr:superoxide dismutase [Deltaproteobacteria bacterium]
MTIQCRLAEEKPLIVLEPLPYTEDSLVPYISAKTMNLHYGKHYAGYVRTARNLIKGSTFAGKTPEEIIRLTWGKDEHSKIFNAVAQAWNHTFFWECMKAGGGGVPKGKLAEKIEASFGSYENFKAEFVAAAGEQFGSGWVWLVMEENTLKVITTANADTPLAHGLTPIFTIDVWEHAYYLDYQNRRADFVVTVLDKLANWNFVSKQIE